MTATEYARNFDQDEFDSPDKPGSGRNMNPRLVLILDIARDHLGRPIIISSGFRTPQHNQKAGGVEDSKHLTGEAVDIALEDERYRYFLTMALMLAGARCIIHYPGHVHVEMQDGYYIGWNTY